MNNPPTTYQQEASNDDLDEALDQIEAEEKAKAPAAAKKAAAEEPKAETPSAPAGETAQA